MKKGKLTGTLKKAFITALLGASSLGAFNCASSSANVKAARDDVAESHANNAMAVCETKFTDGQIALEKQEGQLDPRQVAALRRQLRTQFQVCKDEAQLKLERTLVSDPEEKRATTAQQQPRSAWGTFWHWLTTPSYLHHNGGYYYNGTVYYGSNHHHTQHHSQSGHHHHHSSSHSSHHSSGHRR